MALTEQQQAAVANVIANCASQVWDEWTGPTPTLAQIQAAVAAASTWQDNNQASYVTALPTPFRTSSTAAQKVLLFIAVAAAQYLVDNPDAVEFLDCINAQLRSRL